MSERRPVLDAFCAIFFFMLSAGAAVGFVFQLFDRPCTLGAKACSTSDFLSVSDLVNARYGVFSGGVAVLFFVLGCRMIWGIWHGE